MCPYPHHSLLHLGNDSGLAVSTDSPTDPPTHSSTHKLYARLMQAVPLSCVGADGYVRRLLFIMGSPLVLVGLVTLAVALRLFFVQRIRRGFAVPLTRHMLPIVLRIAFLAYPIVTNVAFEAFSCFTFEDGRGWLIADVTMECNTAEHASAKALAWLAICIYPIGLFLLDAGLLFAARRAIKGWEPHPPAPTPNVRVSHERSWCREQTFYLQCVFESSWLL